MAVIALKDASHPDLLLFATSILNLEVPEHPTREQLIALIKGSGYKSASIEIDDDARRQVTPRSGAAAKAEYTHVNLTIAVQQNVVGGDSPVFVSFDGRGMFIPRGEPAIIPRVFYDNCLVNSVEVIYPETPRPTSPEQSALAVPLETPRFQIMVNEWIVDHERAARESHARKTDREFKAA